MALDGHAYRELLDIINKQISLYGEYLKIQNDERDGLKKLDGYPCIAIFRTSTLTPCWKRQKDLLWFRQDRTY